MHEFIPLGGGGGLRQHCIGGSYGSIALFYDCFIILMIKCLEDAFDFLITCLLEGI